MKTKKILFAIALSSLFSTACSTEDGQDTTSPTIELKAPVMDGLFSIGGKIYFNTVFSDDVELKRYKIDIHDASGHSHTTKSTAWTFLRETDISGKKTYLAEEYIDIPIDAKLGEYHFFVLCTDKAGNETKVFTDIILIE